jgi:hypothetical protein
MKQIVFFACACFLLAPFVQGDGFHDDFSDPELKSRQALRGEWFFEKGTASCVADPELYTKFANHGPILRWPAEFTNGTLEFEFRPKKCQRVVITLNEKGHVFRMSFQDAERTRFFGWIGQSSKTNKPKTIAKEGVPSIGDLDGKWVKSKLVFHGNTADITFGDYNAALKHEAVGRKKGEFTISFASGQIAVRNVRLTTSD